MRKWFILVAILAIFYFTFFGCERKNGRLNKAPQIIQLKLSPVPAGKELQAQLRAYDPENDKFTVEFRWYVDGELVKDVKESTLPASFVKRGSHIRVEAMARDKWGESGWVSSEEIEVGLAPRVIKYVKLEPVEPDCKATLRAGVDCEGLCDEEMVIYYRWYKNGELLEAVPSSKSLEPSYFRKGDRIYVEVSTDEEFKENALVSYEVKINNCAPEFLGEGSSGVANGVLTYQPYVQDRDNDQVRFQLISGPDGTYLDPATGRINWKVPSGFSGEIVFSVKATDSDGASTTQEFRVDIKPSEPKEGD